MPSKKCKTCGQKFIKSPTTSKKDWKNRFYCSRICYWEARKGGKGKYSAYWKGRPLPQSTCQKISDTMKLRGIEPKVKSVRYGKDNNKWKGEDKVGYVQRHIILTKKFGRPATCESCGKRGRKKNGRWTVEWAKKQGHEYTCKKEDYLWLCRKCHANYDNRPLTVLRN